MRKNDKKRRKTDEKRSKNWILANFRTYLGPKRAETFFTGKNQYGKLVRATKLDDFMRKNDKKRRKTDKKRSKNRILADFRAYLCLNWAEKFFF